MKIEKFKLFVEAIFEQSKRLLVKDGYVVPVAFVKCGDNINIIELKFEDDANKQLRILKEIVKDKNADSIVIVVESWLVISGDINIGARPSKHPMRKECILITGECEDGNVSAAQLFHRDKDNKDNDKIVFGEKIDLDKDLFSKFDFGIYKENKKDNKDKQNIDLRDLS